MSDDERDRDRKGRRERPSRFSGGGSGSADRDRSPRGKKRSNRVFVSNIPYEYRWQELKDLFREQVGEVSFVELFVDESDKPRGCGIIEFASPQLAKDAVDKMHRFDLKGRKLVVKEDNDVERDKYGRIIPRGDSSRSRRRDSERGGSSWNDIPSLPSNGPSSTNNASKFGNTYGLSVQFLESLNITGPLVPRVFVANLDYKVDDKKLREVFRLAGRVLSAERSVDKEGKSRGFGVVEYEHPVEAVQAISMLHNQMLFDRRLSVRLDRVEKGESLKLPEGLKGVGMGLGANGIPLQDVARNLPSSQSSTQSNPVTSFPLANPALAAAALGQLGAVTNLIGGQGGGADITSLTSTFGVNTPALASNPLAAQLLSSAAAGPLSAFNSNSGPREFDSLSAALSGGGGGLGGGERSSRSINAPSRPPSDAIIINNLPPGTTWQTLREKCREAGEVKYAEIKGKDTGIVQFTSAWDAQRAINMLDGIRVDGRTIDVRYY